MKDTEICRELAAPKVALAADELVVTGPAGARKLARRADLPASEIKRVDPLFERLRAYRELWKQVHPGQDFPGGVVDVSLDPALEAPRAISIVTTCALAGSPRIHLGTGATAVDFTVSVPPPPPARPRSLRVESTDAGSFVVHLYDEATCKDAGEAIPTKEDGLGNAVSRACTGKPSPCAAYVLVRVPPADRAEHTAKTVASVLAAYPLEPTKPPVRLAAGGTGTEPCGR
jgi:hypothetical protein